MTDRPILFSPPMTRALLDGSKTQTRRVLSALDENYLPRRWPNKPAVGDRLWVRERVYADCMVNILTGERSTNAIVAYYHADDAEVCERLGFNLAWEWKRLSLPSIHMPRYFSRLTLIVENVRVERLQDITEADALAEGVAIDSGYPGSACDAFEALWADINGPTAWATNPWVAAISFRVVRANIDALTDDGNLIHGASR